MPSLSFPFPLTWQRRRDRVLPPVPSRPCETGSGDLHLLLQHQLLPMPGVRVLCVKWLNSRGCHLSSLTLSTFPGKSRQTVLQTSTNVAPCFHSAAMALRTPMSCQTLVLAHLLSVLYLTVNPTPALTCHLSHSPFLEQLSDPLSISINPINQSPLMSKTGSSPAL